MRFEFKKNKLTLLPDTKHDHFRLGVISQKIGAVMTIQPDSDVDGSPVDFAVLKLEIAADSLLDFLIRAEV